MNLPLQCDVVVKASSRDFAKLNFGIRISGDCGKGYFCCGDPPFGDNPRCTPCYST